MIEKMMKILEFDKILEMLCEYTVSENVRKKAESLTPSLSESEVRQRLSETTEGRIIIEHSGIPPLSPMTELSKILSLVEKGSLLMPEQFEGIAQFLTCCRRMKAYLKKAEMTSASVSLYGNSLYDLSCLEEEIKRIIRGSQVDDRATPALGNIRRKIINSAMAVKAKLDTMLRNNSQWFSESFVSIRNGRHTLPVKKEYKNRINGTVIDMSQSGGTYFIEPVQAAKLQEEISMLEIEEENEVRRILYMLTAQVEENLPKLRVNIEAMETLDFIFAKARLSIAMKAVMPEMTMERKIRIMNGRHPLLKAEQVVPLNFYIGDELQGMVITGPNTGGKTVTLKTIGLMSVMAQSGLHVPAEEALFSLNNHVLCDIGDGQSISENLSTFSSHMTNIIEILNLADDQSLVLLDELGSGTDPAEGMGLAVAILEELLRKKCLLIATSHYPEIKSFAQETKGLVNARMAFDRNTLLPLYRLEIGEAGESCALHIATRLGLPKRLVQRATQAAYGEKEIVYDFTWKSAKLPKEPDDKNETGFSPSSERVIKAAPEKPTESTISTKFNVGDSVLVYPQKLIGIVYRKADEKGDVGVQIKKRKIVVNHKRLKLKVPASELYPDNYDFSIIFDTVANRKARRILDRRHDPDVVIESSPDDTGKQ